MGFHNDLFPTDISYASEAGPGFKSSVIELGSGSREVVSRWSRPRYRYDVSYGIRGLDKIHTVRKFFNARRGAANSFPFKDPREFTTNTTDGKSAHAATDVVLGTGNNLITDFQMKVTYTSGSESTDRLIKLIEPGTVLVALDGTPTTLFSVNNTTGVITMNTAPGSGVEVTAGCEFRVPVYFEDDSWLSVELASPSADRIANPLTLVEDVDPRQTTEDLPSRGAKYTILPSVVYQISVAEALHWNFVGDATNNRVLLPDPSNLQPGGEYFYLRNDSVQTITVEDSTGSIKSLATGVTGTALITINSSGNKAWAVI